MNNFYINSSPLTFINPILDSLISNYYISYYNQLFTVALPELTLVGMLTYLLTITSIELGRGRSKKELALNSLNLLCTGLVYIIIMYSIQLYSGTTQLVFNGYLAISQYITAMKLLTVITGRFILSNSRLYIEEHSRHLLEYPTILTLAIIFMLLLIGANHLISAFLALVGFSLNLYVLILFDAPTAIAREAGIKYFYLSAFSSGLIIYGIFLVFLVLKTGHFREINQTLTAFATIHRELDVLIHFGLIFMLMGLFFKLSAFPGHLWAAEVYEGSPDPVTAFFMLPVKVAVLSFVLQLLVTAFEPAKLLWQPVIAISAAISLVWGCVAALVEKKTKRFLAYASINQIGFLLLGLATGSFEGYRATILYLFIYALMNMGFLLVFLNTRRRHDNFGLLYLTDFRGLGQWHSWLVSWTVAIVLFSMAGIPPLAGFFGKYYLLLHAQQEGFYGLVVIALITSLISTYYYLRIIKILWFEGNTGVQSVNCYINNNDMNAFIINAILWTFIFWIGPIFSGVDQLTFSLSSPIEANILFF